MKKKRLKLDCPCGFVGHTRNIRAHRMSCKVWNMLTKVAFLKDKNGKILVVKNGVVVGAQG